MTNAAGVAVNSSASALRGRWRRGQLGQRHEVAIERPLLVVVKKAGATITKEELLKFFDGKIARWWMPDDVAFVEQLPHTATGKLLKTKLREDFKDYQLPTT